MKKLKFKNVFTAAALAAAVVCSITAYRYILSTIDQNRVLKEVIKRLEASTRVAQVIVTDVKQSAGGKENTTIKFLEYDASGTPLPARYFTFSGNIIQFQTLVIRFGEKYVKAGDALRGKSAYLFMKIFMLDGKNTQEYALCSAGEIPLGYKILNSSSSFEQKLWEEFWKYALDSSSAEKMGIRNAQIEAPGTRFIKGTVYTLSIEHDGGLRIDSSPIPQILRGEKIL